MPLALLYPSSFMVSISAIYYTFFFLYYQKKNPLYNNISVIRIIIRTLLSYTLKICSFFYSHFMGVHILFTYILKIYFFQYQDISNCLRFLLLGWEYLPVTGSSKLLKLKKCISKIFFYEKLPNFPFMHLLLE